MLLTSCVKMDAHFCRFHHTCGWNLQIEVLIAVFRIALCDIGERSLNPQVADRLAAIRLRDRNPNTRSPNVRGQSGSFGDVGKFEIAKGNTRTQRNGGGVSTTPGAMKQANGKAAILIDFMGENLLQAIEPGATGTVGFVSRLGIESNQRDPQLAGYSSKTSGRTQNRRL